MTKSGATIPPRIGNWWLCEQLGSGYSGYIFRAKNIHFGKEVALKVQRIDHECPTNRYERFFYPALQGGKGMPTLWDSGYDGEYDWLAIDLLGPNLDSLFKESKKNVMDLRSVCCIAIQVINRLQFMHSRGVLHRDIQLGNCVIGRGTDAQTIYMIDFGFSKFYIDRNTGRHIPDTKVKRDFVGNYWFSSVRVHCREMIPSRRDDLEAVALMLIHLLTPGGLPWVRNGVPKTEAAHDRIKRAKLKARPEDLCRGLPPQFEQFLKYCRRLKFAEGPDYARWIHEFEDLAVECGYPASSAFVWPPPDPKPTVKLLRPTKRASPVDSQEVEGILHALARLKLDDRPILGQRTNIGSGAKRESSGSEKNNPIIISSDDENSNATHSVAINRHLKAAMLLKVARKVSGARDNKALAGAVREFIQVLRETHSRTLTREGFSVLDSLNERLADSAVRVQPLRTRQNEAAQAPARDKRLMKDRIWNLRCDVNTAQSNKALGQMVVELGVHINQSSGRTLTKDAYAFLEGLAAKLQATS
ncbi:CK1/CK1 protein kinase [Wolfiporia cocos MD-104 SS10]|uniref:CK1/CK1 protein kinase n=1 Tax=Wolfiporia cocos (strain MD-104) TaxID=742152 RepID=A0A2H3JRA2_WOLCO|nr:CK1/CK1 protein kinase [Wolfiporia cocos MD-104 SS10]